MKTQNSRWRYPRRFAPFPGRPVTKRTGFLKYILDSMGAACMVAGRGTHTAAVARQSGRTKRTK